MIIKLEIQGYTKCEDGFPEAQGIYFVYPFDKRTGNVDKERLLYIGTSVDIKKRLSGRAEYDEWYKYAGVNFGLCFSYGKISDNRDKLEMALIYIGQPKFNVHHKNALKLQYMKISLSGKTGKFKSSYIIENGRIV